MGKEPILVFLVPKISHFFIWGYNGGVQHDLGVREYQKVENPWSKSLFFIIKIIPPSNSLPGPLCDQNVVEVGPVTTNVEK